MATTTSASHTTPKLHHDLFEGAVRACSRNQSDPKQRELFERIKDGQQPDHLVLCCSDSRVSPPAVFDMPPGRIFEHQNMGNVVTRHDADDVNRDDSVEATICYALSVLKVSHIVILGHTGCGLVRAVMDEQRHVAKHHTPSAALPAPIERWMKHAGDLRGRVHRHFGEALEPSQEDLAAVGENVLKQMERLRSFPTVREALASGQLAGIVGCVFELGNHGAVSIFDDEQQRFCTVNGVASLLPERHAERG